jgi:hypothetical protein
LDYLRQDRGLRSESEGSTKAFGKAVGQSDYFALTFCAGFSRKKALKLIAQAGSA